MTDCSSLMVPISFYDNRPPPKHYSNMVKSPSVEPCEVKESFYQEAASDHRNKIAAAEKVLILFFGVPCGFRGLGV